MHGTVGCRRWLLRSAVALWLPVLLAGNGEPLAAQERLRRLEGDWEGGGRRVEIRLEANQIRMTDDLGRVFVGPLDASDDADETVLRFTPKSVAELKDLYTAADARQVLRAGVKLGAELGSPSGNEFELRWRTIAPSDQIRDSIREIIQRGPDRPLVLERVHGFRLSDFSIDFEPMQGRIERLIASQEKRLDRLKQEEIPDTTAKLQRIQQRLRGHLRSISFGMFAKQTLSQQIAKLVQKRDTLVNEETPEYRDLLDEQSRLLREVQAIQEVLWDVIAAGQADRLTRLKKQFDKRNQALGAVQRRIRQFPHVDKVQAIESQLAPLLDSVREIELQERRQIATTYALRDEFQEAYTELQRRKANQVERRREIEFLKVRPSVQSISLDVQGDVRFKARRAQAGGILTKLDAQIQRLNDQLFELDLQELPKLREQETQWRQEVEKLQRSWLDKGNEMESASKRLAETIENTSYMRAGADLCEALIALREGGPVGMLGEVLQKAAEAIVIKDGKWNENFDETQLRKSYSEKAQEFGSDQAKVLPLEVTRRGVTNAVGAEGRGAMETARKSLQEIQDRFARTPEHSDQLRQVAQRQKERTAEALRELRRTPPGAANRAAVVRQVEQALARQMKSIDAIERQKIDSKRTWRRLNRQHAQLKSAWGRIKLRTGLSSTGKFTKTVAKGAATGMVFDFVKAGMSELEQVQWDRFLSLELAYRIDRLLLNRANASYWEAIDLRKAVSARREILADLRWTLEKERSAFAGEGGEVFIKQRSIDFYREDPSITVRIAVHGWAIPSNVRLALSTRRIELPLLASGENPQLPWQYQHLEGLRTRVFQFEVPTDKLRQNYLGSEGLLVLRFELR